jgi:Acetyltransferases
MKYQIRQALPDEVIPALNLAFRVFIEFDAPEYEPIGIENFKKDCIENQAYINRFISGDNLMLLALDNEKIIGMIDERGNGEISMLFVDSEYHRQGVATALMSDIVCKLKLQGYDKITLHSSTYAVPFYLNYGFIQTDEAINHYGCIVTPMEYKPKEIWDMLDEHGNKTGRYAERGRKLADGDYNLVVQVWKHNGRGEWLIDKRASNKGSSIDGMWETTGGAAVAGDDSLTAALREVKEELGIDLDPTKGTLFNRCIRNGHNGSWLQDTWIFECDVSLDDVRFQEKETCDAMWATGYKIREMMDSGEFLSDWFYPCFNEMMEMYK